MSSAAATASAGVATTTGVEATATAATAGAASATGVECTASATAAASAAVKDAPSARGMVLGLHALLAAFAEGTGVAGALATDEGIVAFVRHGTFGRLRDKMFRRLRCGAIQYGRAPGALVLGIAAINSMVA